MFKYSSGLLRAPNSVLFTVFVQIRMEGARIIFHHYWQVRKVRDRLPMNEAYVTMEWKTMMIANYAAHKQITSSFNICSNEISKEKEKKRKGALSISHTRPDKISFFFRKRTHPWRSQDEKTTTTNLLNAGLINCGITDAIYCTRFFLFPNLPNLLFI